MKPIISCISRLFQRPTSAGWTSRALTIGLVAASLTSCRHVQETTKAPVFDDTPPPVATTLITDTAAAEADHSAPLPELATTSTEDAAPTAEKASTTQPIKATKPDKPKASPVKATPKPVTTAAKPVTTAAKPVKAVQPATAPVEVSTPPAETTKAHGDTVKTLENQLPDKDTATVAPIPTTITAPQYSSTNLLQMLTLITTILILLILIGLLFSFLRFKKRIQQRLDADEKKAVETSNIAWRALETANANKNQNAPPPSAPASTNDETARISDEIANINTAISHLNNKLTKTNVDIANANAELVKTKSELAHTEEKLAHTEEKLTHTEEKLAETEVKLAKAEEKLTEQQTVLCQFASTQTPSKKAASRNNNEPDLFAENGFKTDEAEQTPNNSKGADAGAKAAAAPHVNAPTATPAIDLNEAKESPLKFVNNLSKVYPNFFENLRLKGPSLTNRDLTLCILIALGAPKESLLQHFELTAESFKAARYRIRTKLALERRDNLDEFLQQMF